MNKRILILFCATTLALAGGSRLALAQDSTSTGDPIADAARKAQAAKKNEPKPVKIYTDDNIGGVQGQVSVVGVQPASASDDSGQGGASGSGGDKKAAPTKKDEGYYRGKFAEARRKLADDEKELDVDQREYGLKQQQYYSDPNTAMKEEYSRKELTDLQAEIDKKKQDVIDDQQAIGDLEDDLRQSGGNPGWAREDAPPAAVPEEAEPATAPQPENETPTQTSPKPEPTTAPEPAPTTATPGPPQ